MAKIHRALIFVYVCSAYLFISAYARDVPTNSYTTLGHGDATPTGSNFTFVCDPKRYSSLGLDMTKFPFCDKSLPYDVRASDLVKQMTLSEKVLQLGNTNRGVPRLGLPKYEWWSEALHGVSNVGPGTFFDDLVPSSTSFPTVITSAASFNESLWKTIGLDLDCGEFYPRYVEGSVQQGNVREAEIDKSLKNLYIVLLRLGFFDGIPQYTSLGKKDICSDEHVELAREAAREGTVLLKNVDQTLPLDANKIKTLAVIGPHANATAAMIGNYAGVPCKIVTPLDALSAYGEVDYQVGCAEMRCRSDSLIFPAMQAAEKADATIIVAGIDLSIEAESRDREDLLLPSFQTQLIKQVADAAKGPVILVLFSAGGLDIGFAKNNKKIGAILWAGYPGEKGGLAIADVIFGKYNPAGRLPLTWHEASYADMLPMTSMPLRPVDSLGYPGRTYKFFNGSTVYPFAYGLSYTQFNYTLKSAVRSTHIKLNKFQHCYGIKYRAESQIPPCPAVRIDDMDCKEKINFEVEVKNVGDRDGSEVVVVYSMPPEGLDASHIKQVVGFQRVFVPAGASKKVKFVLNVCNSLRVVDYNAYSVLPSGGHTIVIGDDIISFPVHVNFSS
ncbi:hypothetical protein Tsubulata_046738 [Turnera subulata]|uniref:Fibronectin type III-like domain-containing protein n=1 Tax=Turnera subulata TaxID=218843 RepID=A0A9Q0G919_9ROSI|nr:hypothetical protein Tsubulata_046738 [Turnera subulata]